MDFYEMDVNAKALVTVIPDRFVIFAPFPIKLVAVTTPVTLTVDTVSVDIPAGSVGFEIKIPLVKTGVFPVFPVIEFTFKVLIFLCSYLVNNK
jgi:hypothetical protein